MTLWAAAQTGQLFFLDFSLFIFFPWSSDDGRSCTNLIDGNYWDRTQEEEEREKKKGLEGARSVFYIDIYGC